MTTPDPPSAVSSPPSWVSRLPPAGRSVPRARHPVLQRAADLARHVAPGVLAVSVTALHAGRLRTVTTTGPAAALLDEQQRTEGSGPSLDALGEGRTVPLEVADPRTAPGLARVAAVLGVRHVLAVGLPGSGAETLALTLYGTAAEPFSSTSVALVEALTRSAVDALRPARSCPAGPVQDALRARAAVAQATGVVMAAHECSAEDALALLAATAASQHRSLADVAAAVVAELSRR